MFKRKKIRITLIVLFIVLGLFVVVINVYPKELVKFGCLGIQTENNCIGYKVGSISKRANYYYYEMKEKKNCATAEKKYNSGYIPKKEGDFCQYDSDCNTIDCNCSGFALSESRGCDRFCQCGCECLLGDDIGFWGE